MRKPFSPTRSLQITWAGEFTQKRQLIRALRSSSPAELPSFGSNRCSFFLARGSNGHVPQTVLRFSLHFLEQRCTLIEVAIPYINRMEGLKTCLAVLLSLLLAQQAVVRWPLIIGNRCSG